MQIAMRFEVPINTKKDVQRTWTRGAQSGTQGTPVALSGYLQVFQTGGARAPPPPLFSLSSSLPFLFFRFRRALQLGRAYPRP